MPPLRAALLTALALVVLGLCLGVWAFVIEPVSLRVATTTLELRRWPPACDGLRVAVLADLHVGSPLNGLAKLDEIVARTNRERPDLVLLAGDYVVTGIPGGTFVAPEAFAPALGHLESSAGVFAVLGNHDWWLDGPRVRSALERAGIRVLEDASVRIERGPCSFWLAGIGDYWETPHDVSAALADVPDDGATLALTHNPDVFPGIPARVSLSVAGHTHGGQVYLPLLGRRFVPSRYGERFAIGHVRDEGRDFFVSPGLGTSILPVRFLVPPEISLLELRTRGS